MVNGLVHVYTGNGKGKTTAALGLGLRAAGNGFKVCMFQFLKKDCSKAEAAILEKLGQNFMIVNFDQTHPMFVPEEKRQKQREAVIVSMPGALREVEEAFKDCDLIILDEILCVIKEGLVSEKAVLSIIKDRPENLEIVLTGRGASNNIIRIADYVSDIKAVKHPHDQGIEARKGIEY